MPTDETPLPKNKAEIRTQIEEDLATMRDLQRLYCRALLIKDRLTIYTMNTLAQGRPDGWHVSARRDAEQMLGQHGRHLDRITARVEKLKRHVRAVR